MPGDHCCMPGCVADSGKEECKSFSFHRIPKIPNKHVEGYKEWRSQIIDKICRSDNYNKDRVRICSQHFEPDCFNYSKKGKRSLAFGSLPTKQSTLTPLKATRKEPIKPVENSSVKPNMDTTENQGPDNRNQFSNPDNTFTLNDGITPPFVIEMTNDIEMVNDIEIKTEVDDTISVLPVENESERKSDADTVDHSINNKITQFEIEMVNDAIKTEADDVSVVAQENEYLNINDNVTKSDPHTVDSSININKITQFEIEIVNDEVKTEIGDDDGAPVVTRQENEVVETDGLTQGSGARDGNVSVIMQNNGARDDNVSVVAQNNGAGGGDIVMQGNGASDSDVNGVLMQENWKEIQIKVEPEEYDSGPKSDICAGFECDAELEIKTESDVFSDPYLTSIHGLLNDGLLDDGLLNDRLINDGLLKDMYMVCGDGVKSCSVTLTDLRYSHPKMMTILDSVGKIYVTWDVDSPCAVVMTDLRDSHPGLMNIVDVMGKVGVVCDAKACSDDCVHMREVSINWSADGASANWSFGCAGVVDRGLEDRNKSTACVPGGHTDSTSASNKQYKCDACEYSSQSLRQLQRHIKTHLSVETNGYKKLRLKRCHNLQSKWSYEKSTDNNPSDENDQKDTRKRKRHKKHKSSEDTTNKKHRHKKHDCAFHHKNRYRCSWCNYRCPAPSILKIHMRKHTGKKPFKCTHCTYRCTTRAYLTVHNRIHTGEKPYKCKFCDYRSTAKQAVVIHMRIHTGYKPHKCTYCDYRCVAATDLTKHVRTHTGDLRYKCTECDYASAYSSCLTTHRRTHSGDRPFTCPICGVGFAIRCNLKAHIRIHTHEKPFACRFCDYRSTQSSYINIHERIHTQERPFACTKCNYRSKESNSMRAHQKVHLPGNSQGYNENIVIDRMKKVHLPGNSQGYNENIVIDRVIKSENQLLESSIESITNVTPHYNCIVCGKKFKTSHTLLQHGDVHKPQTNQFPCAACNFRCDNSKTLQSHMMTHTVVTYACKIGTCLYRCTDVNSLMVHQRTHMHDGHYICATCGYSTDKFYECLMHKRTHFNHKQRLFACRNCDFMCMQASELRTHEMTVHKKLFACTHCDFIAADSLGLTNHIRGHFGGKTYKCFMCEFVCNSVFVLTEHISEHAYDTEDGMVMFMEGEG